jgi:mRNA interferase MazF
VLVAFPYADFTKFKKRPALVVGMAEFDNIILCQITSKAETSKRAIPLANDDFITGGLNLDSFIRPDKLFTIEQSIIEHKAGRLQATKTERVKLRVRQLFA